MPENSSSSKSRHHHRHHHRKSLERKIRNAVLIATLLIGILTVSGLWVLRTFKPHATEIVRRSHPVRVIEIVDGDTFVAVDDKNDTLTCRIYGIEAPEADQPYGYEARKYLYNMILQRRVEILPKGETSRREQTVVVITRDNEDVADQLLRAGLAWYRNDSVNEVNYIRSVRLAQEEAIGIWSDPDCVAPWIWRENRGL